MTRSPYKLLDYYRYEDADLFFGREEETRKMVGEILFSRLLVLFSPSGSGKTSLINAGVRPQLEEMGYKTIYTRMEDEPILSVCKAVAESLELPDCREKEYLYEFLKKAAQAAGKPLVIFLDQFEEFFIVFRDQPEMRREFVQQVARIKYDDRLPVFLVLSLREDYFVDLHEFRQDIPSIFQDNANIRLEPFDEKAARRAIEEPLKNKDIEEGQWCFEKELVDAIIQDLKTEEGIEPIKLQLVCCTLWNRRPGDSRQIPLSTYDAVGRAGKIFSNFIYERLSKIPLRKHRLMVRIFESLKTPDNTKRYRSYEDLQSQLNIKKEKRLAALLHRLSGFDLLRQEGRKGTHWYEFKHDYVVDEINQWIKERRERINRKRLLYAVLPGIFLFITLFTYAFIQYNTFYAELSIPPYQFQKEEIIITRGFNPFNERITTGYFNKEITRTPIFRRERDFSDIKDYEAVWDLKNKIKLSFWDKNNWKSLAETLRKDKSGEFLYKIGQKKLGIEALIQAFKDNDFEVRGQAVDSLGRLGKSDKTVIEALLLAMKDENSAVRQNAAASLGGLGKADKNVIEALILAMKDDSYYVQKNASTSLVTLGKANKNVIEALILAMKDEDSYARQNAADSLGRLGKAYKNVIEALILALEDKSTDVRQNAADSLGRLGKSDKNVIEALLLALKDDSYIRRDVAASLGSLGKADKTVISALILALKDEDSDVRSQAADSLGRLGKADKNVIEALLLTLKDEKSNVRRQAAASLGRLGKADNTVIDALILSLEDKDFDVRENAAASLVSLGKVDKTVIDALMLIMKDKDSSLQIDAADLLGRLRKADKNVIEALILAQKDENFVLRQNAAESLGRLGKPDKNVIEALLLALKDESYDVRRQAADSLGRLGKEDKNVIEALILALKDEDLNVRRRAAESLGRLGKADKTVIEALILALKDEDSDVRLQAADSLVRLGKVDKTVIEVLILVLETEFPYLRKNAATLLGRLGKADKTVIEALLLALNDKDLDVRQQAADSLGSLGKADKTVIAALLLALKDESSDVRRQAADSLGILWQNKSDTELIEMLKHPLSEYRTAAAYALAHKKSLSPQTLAEINRLKDKDPRPWVRLGAWKAFELLQEKSVDQ